MPVEISEDRFEELVNEVFDTIPQDVLDRLSNIVFQIEDRPEDGSLDLLGEYIGVALTDRGDYGFGDLPDRIVLYREALCDFCEDEDHLAEEIEVTLMHEIAHYFGMEEDRIHDLGWG